MKSTYDGRTCDVVQLVRRLRAKDRLTIIGLMSGTSADGVSAAVCDVAGSGYDAEIQVRFHRTYSYPRDIRDAIFTLFDRKAATADIICRMNFVLGECFAEKAVQAICEAGLSRDEVDLIGSHGQTIFHSPALQQLCGYSSKSTLQVGEPTVIAGRTGIPTVADFRKADVVAGGEGAPLTPYLDLVLHRNQDLGRVFQNIGGIANLTYVPARASEDDLIAFDTGPGNMVIDAVVRHFTGGVETFDREGAIAARGSPDQWLLRSLLRHPFFARGWPKSTGREEFGERFSRGLLSRSLRHGLKWEDVVATVTELTVETIAGSYERIESRGKGIDEVYVSGGGAANRTIMDSLRRRVSPAKVFDYSLLGYPSEAKESMLMALLASEKIHGNPSNVPTATGAGRRVVLGELYIPA